MPRADGTKQAGRGFPSVRADEAKVQQRMPIYHMAVSSLAYRKGLFDSEANLKIKKGIIKSA